MAAALAATVTNGHVAALLQSWKALSVTLIRQPESPITTIRFGSAFGSGKARPATVARATPAGIAASQTSTGNADGFDASGGEIVGRCGSTPGRARTLIARATPSSSIAGHSAADVIARATGAPSMPRR